MSGNLRVRNHTRDYKALWQRFFKLNFFPRRTKYLLTKKNREKKSLSVISLHSKIEAHIERDRQRRRRRRRRILYATLSTWEDNFSKVRPFSATTSFRELEKSSSRSSSFYSRALYSAARLISPLSRPTTYKRPLCSQVSIPRVDVGSSFVYIYTLYIYTRRLLFRR